MQSTRGSIRPIWSLLLVLLVAAGARGSVSASFLDSGGKTSGTSYGGGTFTLTVQLTLSSASDAVTGIDYQVAASVSNVFELTGRTSGTFFNDPYVADSSITSTYLNPSNGTNLGGGNQAGGTLTGVSTVSVATLSFAIIKTPPSGTFKISFYLPGTDTDYSGAGPNYNTMQFSSVATYSIAVPEPASATLLLMAVAGTAMTRRR